jgi:hypothetical protein
VSTICLSSSTHKPPWYDTDRIENEKIEETNRRIDSKGELISLLKIRGNTQTEEAM